MRERFCIICDILISFDYILLNIDTAVNNNGTTILIYLIANTEN